MKARREPGPHLGALLMAAGLWVWVAAVPAADLDEGFMPKGGRSLLLEVVPRDAAALQALLASQRSQAQWVEFVGTGGKGLSERERATLLAYLSVNMPAPQAAAKAPDAAAMAAALPRDGRDLAWLQCQFCHSLFTSHLTQTRDVQGWRSIFLSPFHREMKMSAQEREEFARYSAINMPMPVEQVPPDLRF